MKEVINEVVERIDQRVKYHLISEEITSQWNVEMILKQQLMTGKHKLII